jgi:hypothetical protein
MALGHKRVLGHNALPAEALQSVANPRLVVFSQGGIMSGKLTDPGSPFGVFTSVFA